MNEKEISEIRRRFRADKSNITHVRGCYVNEKQEIVSQFDQPLSLLPQEECENMLSVLRRTLSGTLGKNLIEMSFTTAQVVDSDEHRLLMALRDSKLTDEEAVQMFFEKVIASYKSEGTYLILLANDTYDVPYRAKDGETLELTQREYELVRLLSAHKGQVFSREALMEQVWNYEGYVGDVRAVDVAIRRLREKIEDDPAEPKFIVTRRGLGYVFNA